MPYKVCEKCSAKSGPRKLVCECGHVFITKSDVLTKHINKKRRKRLKKLFDINWKELEPGQIIKIFQGYGPHYINEDGDRSSLSCKPGKYKVISIDKEGVLIQDGSLREFCYMGPTRPGVVGIKESHKIKLVKKHETEAP
jgi:hypothetical protein